MQMENNYSVLIVGAGIAGLSCAKYLIENHIDDFLILEANEHIGGRCQTSSFCTYFHFNYLLISRRKSM